MSEERKRILEMLAKGSITAEEAENLLNALEDPKPNETAVSLPVNSKKRPSYLFVKVEDGEDRVNIRVPIKLIRAGMKISSLIPSETKDKVDDVLKEKGIALKLSSLNNDNFDEFVEALSELTLDVDGENKEKVRIYCE